MIVHMDTVLIYICLLIFGVIFGSFCGASVWRIRARELADAKDRKQPYDKAEYRTLAPLASHTLRNDRSQCLMCGHQLHTIDLIPLLSWISTQGKCRYCHQKIGYFEPLMEIGVAASLVLIYALWPYALATVWEQIHLGLILLAVVPMAILFAYDLKWFLLPSGVTYIAAAIGLAVTAVTVVGATDQRGALYSAVGAVLILGGIYFVLNKVSRGKWVGFGDVELGLALGLLLADWKLGFITLFAANFIGCLIVLPGMLRGSVKRTTEVQFGPLLIAGAFVALLAGQQIVNWYASLL